MEGTDILSQDHDYLKISEQPKIIALLGNEPVIFSDKMKKINMNDWTQERIIIITPNKIYNIHKNKVKREMQIKLLFGVSKNTEGKKSEFTIHIPTEYDYRLISDKRDIVMQILQKSFADILSKNLKIFHVPENNLKGFTTTEKDKKRGVDRMPPSEFRFRDQDKFEEAHEKETVEGLDFE
jgi:hypothetical protein